MNAAWMGVEGVAFAEQWQLRLQRWREVRQRLLFPQLKQLINLDEPEVACDLGCGEGSTTSVLLSAVPPTCEVTAIDVNRTLLDASRARLGDRVRTVMMDLRTPRNLGTKYDLVLCCNVLMLLDDDAVRATLRWLGEHLSPHGVALVSIVHPLWTLAANVEEMPTEIPEKATFPIGWDRVDAKLYYRTVNWYVEAFSKSCFSIEEERVVTLPESDREFGPRFVGLAGSPMFWVTRIRPSSLHIRSMECEEREP